MLQGHEESQGLENRAITPLVDAHLVRAEKRRGATWFELAHDRLIEPVRQNNAAWYQANLSALQRQAALWEEQHRSPGLLLRGEALEEAERWADTHQDELTSTEHDFLAACREARANAERERRQARRIRWLAIGASIVGAIAVIAFLGAGYQFLKARRAEQVALDAAVRAEDQAEKARQAEATASAERDRAELQARIATSRQLATQAFDHFDDQLDLALLLSVEASQVSDAVEARSALLTGLHYLPYLRTFLRDTKGLNSVTLSPDGRTMASTTGDNGIMLWDVTSHKRIGELRHDKVELRELRRVAFSPDGNTLASIATRGTIIIRGAVGKAAPPAPPPLPIDWRAAIILWDITSRTPIGEPLLGESGCGESSLQSRWQNPGFGELARRHHDMGGL